MNEPTNQQTNEPTNQQTNERQEVSRMVAPEMIALGMVETRGLIGSIEAADAMVKARM
jgi:hypothetical protein